MTGRVQRLLQSIRKEIPQALAEGQDHDDAEVATMLRELGIALVECEQPTQLVAARLLTIANQYTSQTVRVVVLPTALVVQVGTVAYEVETVVKPTTHPAGDRDDARGVLGVGPGCVELRIARRGRR